jgi:peroxiredoxin
MELVYRGTYGEENIGDKTRYTRGYRIESRVFVLDSNAKETELAVYTVLKPKESAATEQVVSVRLERVHIDLLGKALSDPGISLTVPLEGVPTIECGVFVEVPKERRPSDESWEVEEEGRPVRAWRVTGAETVNNTACVKIVGVQQSDDWDQPNGDRPAYRRTDTLWVNPRLGIACKVERLIEHKEAGRKEASQQALLRYDLESYLQYPGQLSEDRQGEIRQAIAFREAARPLLPVPAKSGQQLTMLLNKINGHLEHQSPTPYRDAVLLVKRQVEAAKRGEITPQIQDENSTPSAIANVGQIAPDFLCTNFSTGKSTRLRNLQGKAVLLVFYNPASSISPDVLRYAEKMFATHGQKLTVVGMAVSDDEDKVKKQLVDLALTIPVLHGNGLRVTYGVETTPKLVLIDAAGIVRGGWLGWGQETPEEVMGELKLWMK